MNVLAVILARGGSKGIPKKNIVPLCGHPLLSYTIAAALDAQRVTDLVVSTDAEDIADVARTYGALVPFMRPAPLAEDHVFSRDSLHHAVVESEKQLGRTYDFVIEIPATAPLRDGGDIDGALEKLANTGADSVLGFVEARHHHPVRLKKFVDDRVQDFCSEFREGEGARRQDLEPCFIRNGSIYAMTRRCIVDLYSRFGADARPYVMPEHKSINIDSTYDLMIARCLIEEGYCNNKPAVRAR